MFQLKKNYKLSEITTHIDHTLAERTILHVVDVMEVLGSLRTTCFQVEDKSFPQRDGMAYGKLSIAGR
jgi:hypothetical protein